MSAFDHRQTRLPTAAAVAMTTYAGTSQHMSINMTAAIVQVVASVSANVYTTTLTSFLY